MATENIKNHLCNCEFCKTGNKCIICGSKKELHRCHIVPQHIISCIIENCPEKEEWMSFEGDNIIILCKKHHKELDTYKLKEKNFIIVYLLDKISKFIKFSTNKTIKRKDALKFNRWMERNNNWLFGGGEVINFKYEPKTN